MNLIKSGIILNTIAHLGENLESNATVLDFGCGEGVLIKEFRHLEYKAYGCDILQGDKSELKEILKNDTNFIRPIETDPYHLPFEDNTFDLIFSDQVFEHVQDYSEAISELKRVLKDDGCCLHIFPARYNPIESHVFVPFSSIVRSRLWFRLWAVLGIRNQFQRDLTYSEIAENNMHYLENYTNYLNKKDLQTEFGRYFQKVTFCENSYLKNTHKGKYIYKASKLLPFLPSLFSTFRTRVVFTSEPKS